MAGKVTVNDAVWRDIRERMKRTAAVKIGVLSSKGGDQPHDAGSPLTLVELAAVHEFGSPSRNIPARSFIRRTFDLKKDAIERTIGALVRKIIHNQITYAKAFEILGAWGVAQVRVTITGGAGIPPRLKPATIARKGSSRPLVDTGRLLQSISYEVVWGGQT
jgi:phage gpG-like protein